MTMRRRYWEIDFLRSIAILVMIFFHTTYDIQFLYRKPLFDNWYWEWMPVGIGSSFITLAGISLHLGFSQGRYPNFFSLARRTFQILGWGIAITLLTYLIDFGGKIYFGILHCIGVCTLIAYFFKHTKRWELLFVGSLITGLGFYLKENLTVTLHPSLFWLYASYAPSLGHMLDYYPIVPWLGVLLIGIFIGKSLYPNGEQFIHKEPPKVLTPFIFIGQHSLAIYLLHQPVIYSILYLIDQLIWQ